MSLPLLLQGLGSVGLFASRAFLPAFVTALMLRFGPQIPWLAQAGLLSQVRDVPTWFTSDIALVVLGLLAALELVAGRVPEAKLFLDEVYGYLKPAMAVLTYLGVLNATDRAAVGRLIQEAGFLEYLPVLAVAVGTMVAVQIRGPIVAPLVDHDDLGLQKLLGWIGDLWGGLGPLALIVFPLLTVAVFGFAVFLLVLVERRVASQREKGQVPCINCGRPIDPCALACPFCKAPVKEPKNVGILGQPTNRPANIASLPYQLVAVKRCPVCATRFTQRGPRQPCLACGYRLMDDVEFAKGYIRFIDRRVPFVCFLSFLLGLVPILGIIPGVITYRLILIAPYRRYLPLGHGLLLRWGVRLALVVLVAFQWIPVAGGLALPSMALLNYVAYRSVYRNLILIS
ncbi:zinc ribbon domain-containing protein [Singulisphaera acidiphila]|uniref:DUF4126 domain-containing protein n=1 Tax=Singulisphaera acidiphila (strain ATCC BAA-1392 / DSM 18658 / VKM B-2454 / MOB10) TaxID=886293 RepID=L0DBQ4_SINAD|nr:zinc ribbon domain-containing protein [Singulisphaera acidiphila]AGA26804.1 hypothetical protein Sinac_2495 [Singulisphaera acidiphila DSM 18658]